MRSCRLINQEVLTWLTIKKAEMTLTREEADAEEEKYVYSAARIM
jgi:hypothetical protein